MKSVELFVGAGGLALGIGNSGFAPEAVVEWNHDACETIRLNQKNGLSLVEGWPLHEMDVAKFDYSQLSPRIELVSGGPPCQPFSLGGKHQGYNDSRDMFPQAIRAVRELQPTCFIFENVKGLTRRSFTNYLEYIRHQLTYPCITREPGEGWQDHLNRLERHHSQGKGDRLKYRVMMELLNAANFGVPQCRERLFIVGFREDVNTSWSFPPHTHTRDRLLWDQWISGEYWDRHKVPQCQRPSLPAPLAKRVETLQSTGKPAGLPWRTVRDALAGLPDPEFEVRGSMLFRNHEFRPGARSYQGHTGSPLDEPSKTLKAGSHGVPGGENMLVRPDGSVRYYTVRESARLQTFPDEYVFQGSWSEAMRQLGNAVPVLLAEKVAGSVSTALKDISSYFTPEQKHNS